MTAVRPWVSRCEGCGFWASSLQPGAGNEIEGLEAIRRENFRELADRLQRLGMVADGVILEVGCGRGWFMDEMARRGLQCVALEPDPALARDVAARGHAVTVGFFPAALAPGVRFRAIVFNDVFEHLPDPAGALDACGRILEADGLLAINLPSSEGVLFRVARALLPLGVARPFERLWQKGLSSPHLTYFAPTTLRRLAERCGFERMAAFSLATLRVAGLWARLRSTQGIASSLAMYVPLAGLALASALFPSDIHVGIFRKRDA